MAGSFNQITTGKLHVGAIPSVNLTLSKLLPGLLTVNGPAYFGAVPAVGIDRATVAIGPPLTVGGLPFSLEVTGATNFIGAHTQVGTMTILGAALKLSSDTSSSVKLNVGTCVESSSHITAGKNLTADIISSGIEVKAPFGNFGVLSASNLKSFDIQHPTKEGMRLRYASLEGPEGGVYVRGRTKEKIIHLPDYWTGLVHEESITVSLTPIGKSCGSLHVKKIEDNKIYVSHQASDLEYFYHVFGERKDVDRLIVEYEGNGPGDLKKSPMKINADKERVIDRYTNLNPSIIELE